MRNKKHKMAEVIKNVKWENSPAFPNKKSIFGMTQNELVEHFITTLKQTKFRIANENNLEKWHFKLELIVQSIEAIKIYKEMRKIISMSFENDEDILPEKLRLNNMIIDDKCRLTLLKCIDRIYSIINYDISDFREIKWLMSQIKRIENKIMSPALKLNKPPRKNHSLINRDYKLNKK